MSKFAAIVLLSGYIFLAGVAFADPLIISHRGASYDAPENTIAAFELAWRQGADGIEGDFYLTEDGGIVCIHDATTERTAGKAIKVSEATLAEIRKLDAGSWKGEQWRDTRIPTIEEVLSTVPEGKKIFIEIKSGPEILPLLKDKLAQSGLPPEQTVIISFNAAVIAEAKRQIPRITANWLTDFKTDASSGVVSPSVADIIATLEKIGADGVSCTAHAIVDENFIRALRSAHKGVHIWTVDDVATAKRVSQLNVDSITTNRPGYIIHQLSSGSK